jgi:hypothetical protein
VWVLARGAVAARGALPPEQCIDPDALFPELERRGNRIETVTDYTQVKRVMFNNAG